MALVTPKIGHQVGHHAAWFLPTEVGVLKFCAADNAGGVNPDNNLKAERIGIALSNDLKKWKRYAGNPVFANEVGGIITGDLS